MAERGLLQNENFMLGTEIEIVVAMASIFAVVELFKTIYPEWVTVDTLKRLMPAIPVVLGILGMVIYALTTKNIEVIRAIPLGIMGGSLSATAYELIRKVIKGKVNKYESIDESGDGASEEITNEYEDWSQ